MEYCSRSEAFHTPCTRAIRRESAADSAGVAVAHTEQSVSDPGRQAAAAASTMTGTDIAACLPGCVSTGMRLGLFSSRYPA